MARLRSECISCLLNKYLNSAPEGSPEDKKRRYMQEILKVVAEAPETTSSPGLIWRFRRLQDEYFHTEDIYAAIKQHFNSVMLGYEESVRKNIAASSDPLKTALQYAMVGNFIDFGAMVNVNEERLAELLNKAEETEVFPDELEKLRGELEKCSKLVLLADNCGEVVMDKLLLNEISRLYPGISISVIVRGQPIVNDATMEDAEQVGLTEHFNVVGSGAGVPGTELDMLSPQAEELINGADVILSKGQGNFESLHHCGKNIYYIFLCKCRMFSEMFGVEECSGILVSDKTVIEKYEM